jgi:hypothetical protein
LAPGAEESKHIDDKQDMKMSPFSAHFSGAPGSEDFRLQSERLLHRREPRWGKSGTGKAEDAELPDAGISLKQ